MSTTVMEPDDRLTTLLAALPPRSAHFSLEFFPPKTTAGFSNLQSRLSRMATALRPLFVTVTWGAGGSTATKSLELAEICQRQLDIPTVLHLTCTNSTKTVVDEALDTCRSVGIRNILALRGDPPREEYKEETEDTIRQNGDTSAHHDQGAVDQFVWAVDLVRYIRARHGDYFCIGVAGYPEGHADESHPEAGKQSVAHDLPYLVEKVKAGADFIMTQLTYDVDALQRYEEVLQQYVDTDGNQNPFTHIPVIPGLMPVQSYQVLKRITKLSHAKVPDHIMDRIEKVRDDDELVKKVGVDILSEIVDGIKSLPRQNTARILHFYTLNLEKSVAFILERCRLVPPPSQSESRSGESESDSAAESTAPPTLSYIAARTRRASIKNAQAHNRVILERTDSGKPSSAAFSSASDTNTNASSTSTTQITRQHEASNRSAGIPAAAPSRDQSLRISEGQGSLGREATWDDFPNGRWGPSHSPAFGEIDGYGPSLKVGPITARRLWGHPQSADDITSVFKRHVLGELDAVPWSDDIDLDGSSGGSGALRAETEVIRPELIQLIERGYWTLASQPAVDGVNSDDRVFGWGPRGEGFVFQKAFVEFFCPSAAWPILRHKLHDDGSLEYSWLKTDAQGRFESSEACPESEHCDDTDVNGTNSSHPHDTKAVTSKRTPGTSGVNAVTWGVFRGKEIITPTIIEAESFRAWGEEAYSIWGEWRRCFPRGSVEEKCLERLRQDVVLVNVVGQTYLGGHGGLGGGLWKLLLASATDSPR